MIIGESITCGYGLFDVKTGKCFSDTEDVWQTGAVIAARNFDADIHVISVSGKRLTRPDSAMPQPTMPDINKMVDFLYDPYTEWDVQKYQPDIIIINLGTNDFISIKNDEDRQKFGADYEKFIRELHKDYPNAKILWAFGAMGDGVNLFSSITQAAENVNKDVKSLVHTYRMPHCLSIKDGGGGVDHPNVISNLQYGEDFTKIIGDIMNWKIKRK